MANMSGGGGGGASAVRAGGAFVELFVKDSALLRGLDRAQARVRQFAAAMSRVGVGLAAGGAAISAPIELAFKGAVERGTEFARLGDKLGQPVEQLSAFAFAAETTGQSLNDLRGHFENWSERVAEAAKGGGEAADAFRRLGLDAFTLSKMTPVDQFIALSGAMKQVRNETERLGLLSKFGGDKFQELNPLLKQGPNGIRALMAEAKDLGAVITADQARQAVRITAAWTRAWTAIKSVVMGVGTALFPAVDTIEGLSEAVGKAAKDARAFVDENRELVSVALAVGTGMVIVGTTMAAVGPAIAGISAGLGAATGLVTAFASALYATAPVVLPIVAVAAALAAAGYAAVEFTDVGSRAAKSVEDAFTGLWDRVKAVGLEVGKTIGLANAGIRDALTAADLQLAARIAMAAIEVEYRRGILGIVQLWNAAKGLIVDGWHSLVLEAKLAWTNMTAAGETAFVSLVETFRDLWRDAGGYLESIFRKAAAVAKQEFTNLIADQVEKFKMIGRLLAPGIAEAVLGAQQQAASDVDDKARAVAAAENKLVQLAGPNAREGIEQRRAAEEARLRAEFAKGQRDRDAGRGADEADARAKFNAAQGVLGGLVEQARIAAEAAMKRRAQPPPGGAGLAELSTFTPTLTRGLFNTNGFGAQAFGASMTGLQSLPQLTREGNDLVKQLIASVNKLGAKSLVFN